MFHTGEVMIWEFSYFNFRNGTLERMEMTFVCGPLNALLKTC